MDIQNKIPEPSTEGGVRSVIDFILLLICMVVITARCQISETYMADSTGWLSEGADEIGYAGVTATLIFAGVILFSAVLWLMVRLGQNKINWRPTSLLGPVVLLIAAGVISTIYASNKHIAAVGVITLLSQFVLAVLLVQILNRPWKQHLLLGVLVAAGVVMAYRCAELYYFELPNLVEEYQKNPNKILLEQGLAPGSYGAEQFANRLLSRDVGGYFLISNTAAAFFILSIMTTLALFAALTGRSDAPIRQFLSLGLGLLIIAQAAGLMITQSKGGIAGWLAALILLGLLWWGRRRFSRYWRTTIMASLVLVGLVIAAAIAHGIHHGRLPTLSMWVRWQYWQAGWAIITHHWFTGVGMENFGTYYRHYMIAAAPEVVKDPHSLPIALWSQWGILGLAGFTWAVLGICFHLARPRRTETAENKLPVPQGLSPVYWWTIGLLVLFSVLLVRWSVSQMSDLAPAEFISILVIVFLIPGLVWLISFYITQALINTNSETIPPANPTKFQSLAPLILGCGLLGFLLHNSIDFALFQPGAGTFFFATLALALAIRNTEPSTTASTQITQKKSTLLIILLVAMTLFAGWSFMTITFTRSEYLLARAAKEPYAADTLTAQSARANPWDPNPSYWAGWRRQMIWNQTGRQDDNAFAQARYWLEETIKRDPANHVYYWNLSQHYLAALETAPDEQKPDCAQNAWHYGQLSLQRYPNNSELLLYVGQLLAEHGPILERENWKSEALQLLEKSLAVEQAFTDQQRQMYPERSVITPRLSPESQEQARTQIKKLKETLDESIILR